MESTAAQPAIRAVQNISLADLRPGADPPVVAIPPEEGPLWKLGRILHRRAGLALGLLVIVTTVYLALGLNTEVSYAGQAVVVVPAISPGQLPPGDPDAAVKLAKTYAVAIPLNRDLLTQTAAKANTSLSYLKAHLSVTNDLGTSILRIDYAGQTPAGTAAALGYLTSRLIAANPPTPVIPGSTKLISVPDSVVRDGGSLIDRLPLGLMLGLIVAAVASYVLETTRPRIDGELECADALGLPVSWWDHERISRLDRMLARLEPFDADNLTLIQVVGVDERSSEDSPDLSRKIAAAIWRATVLGAPDKEPEEPGEPEEPEEPGEPGEPAEGEDPEGGKESETGAESTRLDPETRPVAMVPAPVAVSVGTLRIHDEAEAATSKVIVLVRRGTPRSAVTLAAKRLLNQDRTPVWGVLGPSPTFRERRAARAGG